MKKASILVALILLAQAGYSQVRYVPASPVHQATLTLTNAQILTLKTGIAIVAAPGTGRMVVPLATQFLTSIGSGAYGNIQVGAVFGIANDTVGTFDLTNYADAVQILALPAATVTFTTSVVSGYNQHTTVALRENTGVYFILYNDDGLGDPQNLTGGHAANSMTLTMSYLVLNTSTGVFE